MNQPIVRYARELMRLYFPNIRFGGYNRRTTASGGFSFHSVGLAADLHFNVANANEAEIGEMLFYALIRNARAIGIDHVIWNRRIWSQAHASIRTFTGVSPHTNHVHVAFTPLAGGNRPVELETIISTLARNPSRLAFC